MLRIVAGLRVQLCAAFVIPGTCCVILGTQVNQMDKNYTMDVTILDSAQDEASDADLYVHQG